jgi:hypothetical protein
MGRSAYVHELAENVDNLHPVVLLDCRLQLPDESEHGNPFAVPSSGCAWGQRHLDEACLLTIVR